MFPFLLVQSCYSTQCKFLLQIRRPETDIFLLDESQNSYLTCITGTLQNFYHRTSVHQTIMRADNTVLQKLHLGNKQKLHTGVNHSYTLFKKSHMLNVKNGQNSK